MAKKRLKSLGDIRRYLANLINRTESLQIEASLAGKLGYLSSILVRVIEGSDLEKRVQALEDRIKSNETRR
jgi:hypothetical protein